MNKKNYNWWTLFRKSKSSKLSREEFKKICQIYSQEFNTKYHEPCTCSPKGIQRFIDRINKHYLKN